MIGMKYYSEQYYSYQDLKSLKDIIKIDSIGNVNINEDEQIIEYQIDRSKCLRLSDLIEMINKNYVQCYLGQLLTLFNDLLRKVIQLQEKHKINHQYLDDNRIWLIFQDQNKYINIFYSKIDYKIAFTGYQCQLYEQDSDVIIPAEQKILKIIKDILINFKNNKIFINDSQKDKIIKYIYDPIIQECDKLNIQNTLNLIIDILNKYKFNSELQTIELDDTSIKIVDGVRFYQKHYVQEYWEDLIQKLKGENQFIIENIIFSKINILTQSFEKHYIKSTFHFITSNLFQDEVLDTAVNKFKSYYDKYDQILDNKVQSIIQKQFETILKEQLENYKFEISEDDKQNIKESTLTRIKDSKLNKYFKNSVHYYLKTNSNQMLEYQLNFITKLSQSIITEEVELLIDLKILSLIDQLI